MQDNVVPAKAGTHTPPLQWGRQPTPSAAIETGGYSSLLSQGRRIHSHGHFAVPHRCAGGQAFRRVDDGVGVDAVVAIELVDGAGLAEMLNAERFEPMAPYATEPTERGGMTVDHRDDPAVSRQRPEHFFDMAEMRQAAAGPAAVLRPRPRRMQTVPRRNTPQPDIPGGFPPPGRPLPGPQG